MVASSIGSALRFDSSIGLTFARPAQTSAAPATGDMERPIEPAIWASEPRSMMVMPNVSACGVIAPLNASAAASPEPEITAIRLPHAVEELPRDLLRIGTCDDEGEHRADDHGRRHISERQDGDLLAAEHEQDERYERHECVDRIDLKILATLLPLEAEMVCFAARVVGALPAQNRNRCQGHDGDDGGDDRRRHLRHDDRHEVGLCEIGDEDIVRLP